MQIDPVSAGLIGVAASLFGVLVAHRIGLLQISFTRKAHELNLAKAEPRVGCDVSTECRQILPEPYNPHTVIKLKIYNEGELAVQNVTGLWKFLPQQADKLVFEIRRDFLGQCEDYKDEYQIKENTNWIGQHIGFEVDVEFF